MMYSKFGWQRLLTCLFLIFGLVAAQVPAANAQDNTKISRLGEYSGYSTRKYSEWVRTSQYVTARDGTKLALDVVRPSVNGKVVDEKLPILFIHQRYQRADMVDGKPVTQSSFILFWSYWVANGYILASSDMRGTGASFGSRNGELINEDATDAADVIDWLAVQPWSNGRVAMLGVSAQGISQFLAAGAAPKALKAIVPQMAMFDLYSFAYPGGIYRYEFLKSWAENLYSLDNVKAPVPVDEDTDGSMLKAAVAEHAKNVSVYSTSQNVLYRDSFYEKLNIRPYTDLSPNRFLNAINGTNIAIYQISGWYDMWPRDQAAWFNNLTVPKRIVFTPFSHGAGLNPGWGEMTKRFLKDDFSTLVLANFQLAEHLRFFDYYLKDIQNGIMKEAPIWYYVMGAPAGQAWRSSTQWPLANEQRQKLYLQGGKSGSISSINDGRLDQKMPDAASADQYVVDYTTTTGSTTRWHNGHGTNFYYGDMTEQGTKSLTYTSAPLTVTLEITGHPVIHLWVSSTAADGDFFVYLEDVDEKGFAEYITEGVLRASHRKLGTPPFQYMNLPWHPSNSADIAPLPKDQPVELVFDLLPTSKLFPIGHRLRIRIAGADADSYRTPTLNPAPIVSVFRGGGTASYIDLPVIPAK